MLITCWSVKGGSGTTVVAAALAALLSRRSAKGALLVDLGGDSPAVLGVSESEGPGVFDWLAAPRDVNPDALSRLEIDAGGGLFVLPRGRTSPSDGERIVTALADVARAGRPTVVDAGVLSEGTNGNVALDLAACATVSLLVLRPCYLAVRRALVAPIRPTAVVLIEEPERSLSAGDIEDVLGVPVRVVIPWDAAIARCVDAGLLGARIPRRLASALRAAA